MTLLPPFFYVILCHFLSKLQKKWYRKVMSEWHHLFGCTLSPCAHFVTFLSTSITPFPSNVLFSGSNDICVSSFFAVWLERFNCRVDCRDSLKVLNSEKALRSCSSKMVFFLKFHKKTPVPVSLFDTITGLKKWLQRWCFPVNFAKVLRTHF